MTWHRLKDKTPVCLHLRYQDDDGVGHTYESTIDNSHEIDYEFRHMSISIIISITHDIHRIHKKLYSTQKSKYNFQFVEVMMEFERWCQQQRSSMLYTHWRDDLTNFWFFSLLYSHKAHICNILLTHNRNSENLKLNSFIMM